MTAVATATLTGCCSKSNEAETAAEFVDDVKVALADSGRIDLSKLQWTREPKAFEVKGDTIAIRPVAAHVLSLPERQCARAADEDKGEILQLRGEDRLYAESPAFRPVRHRDVSRQRKLAERVCGIRERRVPALRQRGYKQGLFRLGYDSHPRRCQDDVVSFLAPRG